MTADALLQILTQVFFVLIFAVTLVSAVQRPRRANVDTALLFGALAFIVLWQWLGSLLAISPPPIIGDVNGVLLMAVPYLLLRLLSDFTHVPRRVMRLAEMGLAVSAGLLFLFPPEVPGWMILVLVAYFVVVVGYDAAMFAREATRSRGVTRRRMQAVAFGSACLAVLFFLVALRMALPTFGDVWSILSRLSGLAAGLAYYLGFAPPQWLRRAWQGPELREFLSRAASLPRLPDTDSIVTELERGAARSLGTAHAAVGLWVAASRVLRFPHGVTGGGEPYEVPPGKMLTGRCFVQQRPVFSANAERDDPEHADLYRAAHTCAVLAAPITAGERRLGVLRLSSPREPIFAEDDLELVKLLANQAAVVLESRALIDEAARVQAREEATRLKDDFLSAAAHDLRTPLTTLIGQAQLMERKARRVPDSPADLASIERIVNEAKRLGTLVQELLDAGRAEQGRLVGERVPIDLVQKALDASKRPLSTRHTFTVSADEPVIGMYDEIRMMQLFDNLLENAVKYTPDGGEIQVNVWREGQQARVSVADPGIGIPPKDLPYLFERFHRGSNVDDRRFAGMGLGLYICRAIVEQHGGRIWAESPTPGGGTVFHVALPIGIPEAAEAVSGAPVRGG
jgi:signal transduction histidine kinase